MQTGAPQKRRSRDGATPRSIASRMVAGDHAVRPLASSAPHDIDRSRFGLKKPPLAVSKETLDKIIFD
jgi:hypothetical protein